MCVPYHPEKFGENLVAIREAKGIGTDELASKVGVSADDVKAWEAGPEFPEMEVIAQTCSALECDFATILAQ